MRRGGLLLVGAAGVLLTAGVVAVAWIRYTDDPDEAPTEPGRVRPVVGYGRAPLPEPGQSVEATQVDPANLVAMAVEADGTLWLVDAGDRVYRVRDGEISQPRDEAVASAAAAAAIGPEGNLYVVGNGPPTVSRLDLGDLDEAWARTDLLGLPEGVVLTGLAVADDGAVFVADGVSGSVFRVDGSGSAEAVAGTGYPACGGVAQPGEATRPPRVGIAVDAAGDLFVADERCHSLYGSTGATSLLPPDCPDVDGTPNPGAVAEAPEGQLVVTGPHCNLIWLVSHDDGAVVPLAEGAEALSDPLALAVDGDGTVYGLGRYEGVVALSGSPGG